MCGMACMCVCCTSPPLSPLAHHTPPPALFVHVFALLSMHPFPLPLPDDRAAVEELGQKLRRGALKVGFLMKCGDHNKTWHRRWFILGMDCLGYFESDLASAPLGA